MKKQTKQGLMNPAFQYRSAANTNVSETWKRFGWVPPTEIKEQKNVQVHKKQMAHI